MTHHLTTPSAAPRDRVLTWVLPLLPAVVALVLLVLAVVSTERILANELERRASFRVEQATQLYADQLSRVLARRTAELQLLGEMARAEIRVEHWRDQMQRLKASSGSYVWIGVTNAYGQVEAATDGLLEGVSIATRGVYVNGKEGLWFGSLHPPVALVEPLRNTGRSVPAALADIAMPVLDANGDQRGVLASHLDAGYFETLRQNVLGPLDARRLLTLALVDREGRVLLGERPNVSESEWRALFAEPGGSSRALQDANNETYLLSRSPIQPTDSALRTDWQVVGSQPLSAALAPVRQFERGLLVWGGLTTLLLGFAGFAASRHLSRPYSESEQSLREQGEVLSAVINSASDAVISVGLDGRITLFNPAAARIFGHPAGSMMGQPLDVLLPPVHRSQHMGYLQRFAESQATTRPMGVGRVTGLHASGHMLELEASISQITVRGNKVLTAILRDVTERVRGERALAQSRLELSELTHRLLQQEKQTTRKLAQTLHDQLGQTLGAIRLTFDSLQGQLLPSLPHKVQERAVKLGEMIETANAEVRQALVELRPPLLDESGLQVALENEVQVRARDAETVALCARVSSSAAGVRWPADVEYAAFMVAREALANAVLHAQASKVIIDVDGTPGRLRLCVTDDGKGLSPDLAAGRPGHLGIVGMRERALAIGARMEAKGSPNGGTVISLTWQAKPDAPGTATSHARP
ncbi:PAS domain S-box protein [Hydrogenophaga laconesensis]|uniref:PAS domain S-box protein n=1 Tax=Hydrogenophaga laconesensis TaxID=1805971 RepID=UPI00286A8B95|nr:PAS domain S-box protein [Hydrogenophaga laconesensis]